MWVEVVSFSMFRCDCTFLWSASFACVKGMHWDAKVSE